MKTDDRTRRVSPAGSADSEPPDQTDQEPDTHKPEGAGWSAQLRQLLQRSPGRDKRGDIKREHLKEDRTKAFLVLAGATVVLGLVFFALFSSPASNRRASTTKAAHPNLGRVAGGNKIDAGRSVTPLLNADTRSGSDDADRVSEQDIENTAKPRPTTTASPEKAPLDPNPNDYALNKINFPTDPQVAAASDSISASKAEQPVKASLVFVRATTEGPGPTAVSSPVQSALMAPARTLLPAGTRLIARIETPVSSAIKAPAVAAIEYNYERDGEIVIPAGAKAFGELQQANEQGYVGIRFHTIQFPDETEQPIEAVAMGLGFQPLRGAVTGRNRAKRFLVESVTGLGELAAATVGVQSGAGLTDSLSNNVLLRERLANNVAIAGEQQLNDLAARQNIVVTVPGNTRFYLVLGKPATERSAAGEKATSAAVGSSVASGDDAVPSVQELRELLELRQELTAMYQQQQKTQLQQTAASQ